MGFAMRYYFPLGFVFTGPPCSGKTTTLQHIESRMGWEVIEETGRQLIDEAALAGLPDPRTTEGAFTKQVIRRQLHKEKCLPTDDIYLFDRSVIDCVAHARVTGDDALPIFGAV